MGTLVLELYTFGVPPCFLGALFLCGHIRRSVLAFAILIFVRLCRSRFYTWTPIPFSSGIRRYARCGALCFPWALGNRPRQSGVMIAELLASVIVGYLPLFYSILACSIQSASQSITFHIDITIIAETNVYSWHIYWCTSTYASYLQA